MRKAAKSLAQTLEPTRCDHLVATLAGRSVLIVVDQSQLLWEGGERAHGTAIAAGESVCGLCSSRNGDYLIRICPTLSRAQRFSTLVHELRHVWTFEYGLPADGESDAEDVEAFYVATEKLLADTGLRTTLHSMRGTSPDRQDMLFRVMQNETVLQDEGREAFPRLAI